MLVRRGRRQPRRSRGGCCSTPTTSRRRTSQAELLTGRLLELGCRGASTCSGSTTGAGTRCRRTGRPARRTTWRPTRSPRSGSSTGQVVHRDRAELADSLVGTDEDDAVAGRAGRHPVRRPGPHVRRGSRSAPGCLRTEATLAAATGCVRRVDARRRVRRRATQAGCWCSPRWCPTRDVAWAEITPGASGAHVELWRELVRRSPRDLLPGACSLLAFAAWQHGDGALAWCAHRPLPRGRSRLLDGPLRRRGPDPGGAAARLASRSARTTCRSSRTGDVRREPHRRLVTAWLATRVRHGYRSRPPGVHPLRPHPAPGEGAPLPRRLRPDAARVPLRRREPDDRHGDRVQPRRRRGATGAEERRGARGDRQPAASRPSWRSSTSRSTCCRDGWARAGSPASRTTCAAASTRPRRKSNEVHAHMVMIGILPTLEDGHLSPSNDQPQPALQAAQRPDPGGPRARTSSSTSRAPSGCGRPRSRSCPRRRARAPSCTPRSARTTSRRTGTPPRRSAASSSRSAPTRRTCSASSCGRRPGSRSSSRPPTPAARSSRSRACGRGCGSASAGSTRSSTCSRRTCATSRRCSRSPTTRIRWRCSRPAARPPSRS